jgi:hypothetical protein
LSKRVDDLLRVVVNIALSPNSTLTYTEQYDAELGLPKLQAPKGGCLGRRQVFEAFWYTELLADVISWYLIRV